MVLRDRSSDRDRRRRARMRNNMLADRREENKNTNKNTNTQHEHHHQHEHQHQHPGLEDGGPENARQSRRLRVVTPRDDGKRISSAWSPYPAPGRPADGRTYHPLRTAPYPLGRICEGPAGYQGSCSVCGKSFWCPTCSPSGRRACACNHLVLAARMVRQCAGKEPIA
jgi:hypothetical protein